jgi:hypothetical protein
MHQGKPLIKYIVLGIMCLVVLVAAGAALFYHHFTDYDIYSFLLKTPMHTSQPAKQVSALSQIHHIFIIVEENHDWQRIYQNPSAPFINTSLLPQGAFAKEYYNTPKNLNELHPSEPNYILLEAGKIAFADHTFTTDNPPSAENSTGSPDHLTMLLEKYNLTWKAYQEDIPGTDCPVKSSNNYVPKHNPFVFFQDVSSNPPDSTSVYCRQHIRPFTELHGDLASSNLANYSFITPNVLHDMHDGTIAQADSWLATVVPEITSSKTFQKDGALFITWDEGNGGEDKNTPIGMIILSPFVKHNYTNSIAYSHASFVKTVEEVFHVSPLLGLAADPEAQDLSDFFTVPNPT